MLRPVLATLCALATTTLPAHADKRLFQYGDVVFPIPEGWSGMRDSGPGYKSLQRWDAPCKNCMLYVTGSQRPPRDLADWLNRSSRSFSDATDPRPEPFGEVSVMAGGQGAMGVWQIGDDWLMLMGLPVNDRAVLVGLRIPGRWLDAVPDSLAEAQTVLAGLSEDIYVTPQGGPAAMPPPQPGPLDGIYWGTVTRTNYGLDGMMQFDIQGRAVVFWPEGWFYDGAPANGMAPPTARELIPTEAGDTNWGTYRIEDGMVRITYTNGYTDRMRMTAGASLYDGDRQMFQAEMVPDGLRFSGSQSWSYYSGFNPVVMSGGVASRSHIFFSSDGTYSTGGWSSVSGTMKGPGIGANQIDIGAVGGFSERAPDGGRYEVKGGVIHMIPDDGSRPYQRLIYRIGGGLMVGTDAVEGN